MSGDEAAVQEQQAAMQEAQVTMQAVQPQQQQQQQQQMQQMQVEMNSSQEAVESESDRASKRSAQLGQWRTPPQAFFSSGATAQVAVAAAAPVAAVAPVGAVAAVAPSASAAANDAAAAAAASEGMMEGLKDFDLDSLKEAYRRGVAAAAALSQHQMATGENVFAGITPDNKQPQPQPVAVAPPVPAVPPVSQTAPASQASQAPAAPPAPARGSASCPNFQSLGNRSAPQLHTLPMQHANSTQPVYTPTGTIEEPDPQVMQQQHQHHQQQQQQHADFNIASTPVFATATAAAAPPPTAPVATTQLYVTSQQMQPTYAPTEVQPLHQPPAVQPQQPTQISLAPRPENVLPTASVPAGVNVGPPMGVGVGARSVSLPDMQSYAASASTVTATAPSATGMPHHQDKRQKRLARNRASARMRRLRKKNLVENYEGEVGVLEASLEKLRAHTWGQQTPPNPNHLHPHEALLEALSMDRGQQNLSLKMRGDMVHDILTQQRDQVASLMDAQLETMMLGWLANKNANADQQESPQANLSEEQQKQQEEEDQLAKELNDVLKLSPEQVSKLQEVTKDADKERHAIHTVDMCLEAMMNNGWLWNQGVEESIEQFLTILNAGQISKFLLWTDHNSEAIDHLDYVNAPPAAAPPLQTPSFVFGTDDCLNQEETGEDKV